MGKQSKNAQQKTANAVLKKDKNSQRKAAAEPASLNNSVVGGLNNQLLVVLLSISIYLFYFYFLRSSQTKLKNESVIYGKPARWYKNTENVNEFSRNYSKSLPLSHPLSANMMNFNEKVLEPSKSKYVLLVTYDPFSSQYLKLGHVFEEVGLYLQNNPSLLVSNRTAVVMVNAATNGYISFLYTRSQFTDWLGENERGGSWNFEFGHPNFRAIGSSVIHNGAGLKNSFAERITKTNILRYLSLLAEPVVTISSVSELDTALQERGTTLIFCDAEGYDCEKKGAHFLPLVERQFGTASFGIVRELSLCQHVAKPVSVAPCSIIASGKLKSTRSIRANASLEELDRFVQANSQNFLPFVSVKKIDSVARANKHLVMLLINQEDEHRFDNAENILEEVAKSVSDLPVEFIWVHGPTFVQDYELTSQDLPNLVYISSLQNSYSVYSSLYERYEFPLPFSQTESTVEVEKISAWIRLCLDGWGLQPLDENIGEQVEESEESLRESEEGEISDPISPKRTQNTNNIVFKRGPLIDERWHSRAMSAKDYFYQDIKLLWTQTRQLWTMYLRFEQIYAAFSAEEREREEEEAFAYVINKIRSFIAMKEFRSHSDFFRSIPANPELLKGILLSNEKRNLLKQIERFDIYRIRQFNKINRDEEFDYKYLLASLAAQLEEGLLYLHSKRGELFREKLGNNLTINMQQRIEIDRVSADELTMVDFVSKYAEAGKPVVITGLRPFKKPLTMDRIVKVCGDKMAALKEATDEHFWAGLKSMQGQATIEQFVHDIKTKGPLHKHYLHDFSIPILCPDLMGNFTHDEFILPKYFAGDWFQRLPFYSFQHTWPSLFVGANGTYSRLHVDNGGSHFWMYLEQGQKEWYVFDKLDIHNLYVKSNDLSFSVDVFNPNLDVFPLYANAKLYRFTQNPGELVFIPANSPHAVQNKDDIVGFSMNYVDQTNQWIHLWELLNREDFGHFEEFVNDGFPKGLRKSQRDLTFSAFKSQEFYDMEFDL